MKKLMYLFAIILFSQVFFACSQDTEADLLNENTTQSDVDWGDDTIEEDDNG